MVCGLRNAGDGNTGIGSNMTQMDLQDGKLPRFQHQDWEDGETDNEARQRGQIASAEDEQAIPSAYCRLSEQQSVRMPISLVQT